MYFNSLVRFKSRILKSSKSELFFCRFTLEVNVDKNYFLNLKEIIASHKSFLFLTILFPTFCQLKLRVMHDPFFEQSIEQAVFLW